MNTSYDPRTGTITEPENKWFVSEAKLNPDQKRLVDSINPSTPNLWIKGPPGTGKSLVLLHIAHKILEINPSAKILLVVFTKSLAEMFKTALREFNLYFMVTSIYRFMNDPQKFDYILCDEVEDFTPKMLATIEQNADHLIVAGDAHQSIYTKDQKWKENTVDMSQLPELIHCKTEELTIIERFSTNIMQAVQSFLGGNFFGSCTNLNINDSKVTLYKANSLNAEVSFVVKKALKNIEMGYTSAILIPNQQKILDFINLTFNAFNKPEWEISENNYGKPDFGALNRYFYECNLKIKYIGNGYGYFNSKVDYVVISSYYSAKGIDFDYIFLPFCNNNLNISYDRELAKRIFLVALTRARMNVYISYTDTMHEYVQTFANNCSIKSI